MLGVYNLVLAISLGISAPQSKGIDHYHIDIYHTRKITPVACESLLPYTPAIRLLELPVEEGAVPVMRYITIEELTSDGPLTI